MINIFPKIRLDAKGYQHVIKISKSRRSVVHRFRCIQGRAFANFCKKKIKTSTNATSL